MPGFLRVNRNRVHLALEWLKKNNPIYRDVEISTTRLAQLPVNGVPDEISSTARYSEDITLLNSEGESYIPDDIENGLFLSLAILSLLTN